MYIYWDIFTWSCVHISEIYPISFQLDLPQSQSQRSQQSLFSSSSQLSAEFRQAVDLRSDKLPRWHHFFLRKKCGCYSYSSYVHLQLIRVTGLLCCALMRIWQRCNCIPPNTMMMFWFKSKCFLAIANHFKSVILRYPSTSIPCHS